MYLPHGNFFVSITIETGVWSSGMILALGDYFGNTNLREALGSIPSMPPFFFLTGQYKFTWRISVKLQLVNSSLLVYKV